MALKDRYPNHFVISRVGEGYTHVPLHHYFVPNYKSKSKSRAASHALEFLSRVFADEGASRFFRTFLLRFLMDGSGQSSDDASTGLTVRAAS
ncbi:MAG TPA: hypothetical protein V6C99_08425 [Oculatellaceae cyanobacterium]|jgi:hypothetical protein